MRKIVALFDFDGTLIKGNSLPRFLWFYVPPWIFIHKLLVSMPILFKYILGLTDNHTAKEQIFTIFFAGENKRRFAEKAQLFSKSVIPSLLRDEAIQRLKWHQEQNQECILISASIQEYLVPWAERAGFSKVLATNVEVDNGGNLTGKFFNKNCHGNEKVQRIREYLGSLKQYEIYVYGDSRGDMELLEIANHPFHKSFNTERAYSHG